MDKTHAAFQSTVRHLLRIFSGMSQLGGGGRAYETQISVLRLTQRPHFDSLGISTGLTDPQLQRDRLDLGLAVGRDGPSKDLATRAATSLRELHAFVNRFLWNEEGH
jgi:hypothetical protein